MEIQNMEQLQLNLKQSPRVLIQNIVLYIFVAAGLVFDVHYVRKNNDATSQF